MEIRKAAFSGSWYPDKKADCEADIRKYLEESSPLPALQYPLIGGIVPHAGWFFSGSIACNVISCLKDNQKPDVIVIFGMHLGPGLPCYIMDNGTWETPIGELPVNTALAAALTERFEFQVETPRLHTQDNTIELQLPFIKYFFPDVKILTIGVPPGEIAIEIGKTTAEIINESGLGAKIIGSTDLTHYGPNYGLTYSGSGTAAHEWVRNENDRRFIDAVISMNPETVIDEALAGRNACCPGAVAATLAAVKELGAVSAKETAYATSYEKSPGESFVGYVGMVFES